MLAALGKRMGLDGTVQVTEVRCGADMQAGRVDVVHPGVLWLFVVHSTPAVVNHWGFVGADRVRQAGLRIRRDWCDKTRTLRSDSSFDGYAGGLWPVQED